MCMVIPAELFTNGNIIYFIPLILTTFYSEVDSFSTLMTKKISAEGYVMEKIAERARVEMAV